jgi:hypothetical protein
MEDRIQPKVTRCRWLCLLISLVILTFSPPARADWINLTGAENAPNIAEIYVEDDHVRLVLEIFVKDLVTFHRLIPDELLGGEIAGRPPLTERMHRFSLEDFQFVTGDGMHLQAEVRLAEPRLRKDRPSPFVGVINPATGKPVPGPPEDKRVLYAELVYPFTTRPETLIIVPPLDDKGNTAVSIGFIAYHKGVPVVDFRYLSHASRLHLDWDDPWYSSFEKKALKRWQQSGVMTFLYIEPYEVRHETMVRVRDMATWMDLGLSGDEFIEVDELGPLKKRIGEFLLQHSKVRIDGKQLRPILDRTSFVKYTMTRTFFIEQPERMPLNTAMLGVIITYLTEGIPQEVTVDWDLFSDRIQKVPTNAVDPAGPFPSYVTPEDNVLIWKNFLKTYKSPTVAEVAVDDSLMSLSLPIGSILCLGILLPVAWQIRKRKGSGKPIGLHFGLVALLIAGSLFLYPYFRVIIARPAVMAPKMTDEEAVVILHNLLKNIYRSFDFREEEDVYDRLATSVSGDLLAEIYLQNRKSLVVTQAGGAQARVKEVKILNAAVDELDHRPLGLLFHTGWTAMGTVGHWGHIHVRQNQYEANITVEPVDGAWKVTGLELLEEKRIDPYAQPAT